MRLLVLSALALAFIAGCDSDDSGPASITGGFQADFKTATAYFTLMEGPEPGSSPHGTSWIFYSSNIKSIVGNTTFTVPQGTTSIKEFDMGDDGTVDGFAVMVKREKGYDAANGDWYYEMRDTSGNVMADPPAGATPMCIGCHTASKSTDYLAGTKLR